MLIFKENSKNPVKRFNARLHLRRHFIPPSGNSNSNSNSIITHDCTLTEHLHHLRNEKSYSNETSIVILNLLINTFVFFI